jgi:hypothetical protein
MIVVTHTGKAGDFGLCLPICSWLHKTYKEKIIFVLPRFFPFIKSLESLIKLQPFTEDILYCDHYVRNYDCGGQPYKFDPKVYFPDLEFTRYYNFGFRGIPDKYVPYFYAEEYGLGVDEDFVLNLGLDFKYTSDKLMCTEIMHKYLPHFEQTDLKKDFLLALRDFAYAKERHMHFSSLAVYLGLARIPFYLYNIVRFQPIVDTLEFSKTNPINPEEFWIYYQNAPVLDVRSVDENDNLISIYNQIFFKS